METISKSPALHLLRQLAIKAGEKDVNADDTTKTKICKSAGIT
jgi:hypothetical protein